MVVDRRQAPAVMRAVLGGLALGSVAYVAALAWLARWHAVVRGRGGSASHPGVVLMVALVCAIGSSGLRGRRSPARLQVAMVMIGSGVAWVVWGLIEQHVLRTFVLAPGSPWAGVWDGLFHGAGLIVAAIGTAMAGAGDVPLRFDRHGP